MSIVVDKTPDLKKAFEILEKYSSDPQKRREIEEKIKADRDYAYALAGSFEAGEKKGKTAGKIEDARRFIFPLFFLAASLVKSFRFCHENTFCEIVSGKV